MDWLHFEIEGRGLYGVVECEHPLPHVASAEHADLEEEGALRLGTYKRKQ